MSKLTPMMKQYMDIKKQYRDCIVFFRLGDFYEMFFDDALTASKALDITLTARDCGQEEKAPMCGVPHHSSKDYIAKLVEQGYKVAICEQVEEPGKNKIVKREVVRTITPGTLSEPEMLDSKTNNFLCSIHYTNKYFGVSYVDITTGSLYLTSYDTPKNKKELNIKILAEIDKINPSEIISNVDFDLIFDKQESQITSEYKERYNKLDTISHKDYYSKLIKDQFNVISLEAIGIFDEGSKIKALGQLLDYLYDTQKSILKNINELDYYTIDDYMIIDTNTRRNLELIEPLRNENKNNTLYGVLDKTDTAMGARLLKKWIREPLRNKESIDKRLNVVQELYDNIILSKSLSKNLKDVYDIERLTGKVAIGTCNPRDLISLKTSLKVIPEIKDDISKISSDITKDISVKIDTLKDIYLLLENSIIENPSTTLKDGNIIKFGYHDDLDELKNISKNGKDWILSKQNEEREKTGIKKLKIGYNKVFGYYIEVTKSYIDKVPEHYTRKQTLSNSERYITPDLKEMESKILSAEEKMNKLQYEIFLEIREELKNNIKRMQKTSQYIAAVDVLNSFCKISMKNNYIRPEINTKGYIDIKNGRHCVVENMLTDESFIPNDTFLDKDINRFSIITGPNMAGKSTYMRQVALICIMGHIGCFVPASKANIPILDKIFTRVGASDNLSQGQSTFMVEMSEVSYILKNATEDSLIILDEIGRGTSTYDGLSIAWSVTEYIAKEIKSKCMFATHYHELSELENKIQGVNNYKILIKESGEDIIFLRKVSKGSIDKSYGIEVARLAGLPYRVINNSFRILNNLEDKDLNKNNKNLKNLKPETVSEKEQMKFWNFKNEYKDFIDENLLNININKLTPIEALNILNEIIEKSGKLGE
ncbi:MAG: DNA mismatch repair protein MutS [Eubacteriales bacterium]